MYWILPDGFLFVATHEEKRKKKCEWEKEKVKKTSKLTLTMRDGWRKKYALEYEVKSGKKANRLFARILSFSLAPSSTLFLFYTPSLSIGGGVNEYVNFFGRSPIFTPQSRKVSILDWHLNVLVCIYKATLFLYSSPSSSHSWHAVSFRSSVSLHCEIGVR